MSAAPIMPFFTDAYLADCHHLSTEAHGAYLLILLHTWRLGGKALPDDDVVMMRIVKVKTSKRWKQLKAELVPFFNFSDGSWRQKKLERTWADVTQKIEANRENGKLRHVKEKIDKPLKFQNQGPANAANSLQPSINHEPKPNLKPIIFNKEDDMIMATITSPSKVALEALEPILRDSNYFLHRSNYRASPQLKPQIEQAIIEMDEQLTPTSSERTAQIVTRLMMHFPCPAGEHKERIHADYTNMLQEFPDDMLCAAYQHVLKNHKYHTLPKIADMIGFMDPEMARRKTIRRKLDVLKKQASEGANA